MSPVVKYAGGRGKRTGKLEDAQSNEDTLRNNTVEGNMARKVA